VTTVIAFSFAAISIAALIFLVAPGVILENIRIQAGSNLYRLLGILIRAILGIAFLVVAPNTQNPTLIYILGALFFGTAIVIGVMPKEHFVNLTNRYRYFPQWAARLGGALALIALWYLVLILL
tara:strand:+ start:694 stop:1065 length:372 start_codon:yes stop_codon:yes gene_type:complete